MIDLNFLGALLFFFSSFLSVVIKWLFGRAAPVGCSTLAEGRGRFVLSEERGDF